MHVAKIFCLLFLLMALVSDWESKILSVNNFRKRLPLNESILLREGKVEYILVIDSVRRVPFEAGE
jgi:hypothetical protein